VRGKGGKEEEERIRERKVRDEKRREREEKTGKEI